MQHQAHLYLTVQFGSETQKNGTCHPPFTVMALLLLFSMSMALSFCRCDLDTSKIRIFPASNQSIAGVFQVSFVNDLNQVHYALDAFEARSLCLSLGVNVASISQVQMALTRGLETCRFGWTDEHLPVVPRIRAQLNCGNNNIGLVKWRAPLTKKFDVFCFNESDADTAVPLEPTTTPIIPITFTTTSQPIVFTLVDSEAEKALIVGSAQGSSGKKTVIITSVAAVFLVALVAVVYIKVKRNSDKEPHIERDEWTQVKYTDTKKGSTSKVDNV